MTEKTFLIEIGTEELPPKSLRKLAEDFALQFHVSLNDLNLTHDKIEWFATPRRLALKVMKLSLMQPECNIEIRGPSVDIAFNAQGDPTSIAYSWANAHGITLEQAEYLNTKKGSWLVYRSLKKGEKTQVLLPKIIITALNKLKMPKVMRWGENDTEFIRPVHTVTLLLGNELINTTILGIKANRVIRGHRFMGESRFIINDADEYPEILLTRGKVIADYELRKLKIQSDVQLASSKLGGEVDLSNDILEEVTSLVEWPIVLTATFESKFLSIPSEALVHTLKSSQKYFPIYNTKHQLLPHFIFVVNIESAESEKIIKGNERVVRARLTDAEFFFKQDRKAPLENNLIRLKNVIFEKKLGTLFEKTIRVQKLAIWIASRININQHHTSRAALLCKCDLLSRMVFEFPDIQGVIGMYYAQYDGEREDIAVAIKEHYLPRFLNDMLPSNLIGCTISLADKIDTITGIFGIGYHPKGDKDPFALRRTSLAILRILIEKKISIDLKILIQESLNLYINKFANPKISRKIIDFILHRFYFWYQQKGHKIDTIQSVIAIRPTQPLDFDARIHAVSYLRSLKEAGLIIATNKRILNILNKYPSNIFHNGLEEDLLQQPEEIKLATLIKILNVKLDHYLRDYSYQKIFVKFIELSIALDIFFKNVMVNTSDKNICTNRLKLLSHVRTLFLKVADISLLQLK